MASIKARRISVPVHKMSAEYKSKVAEFYEVTQYKLIAKYGAGNKTVIVPEQPIAKKKSIRIIQPRQIKVDPLTVKIREDLFHA